MAEGEGANVMILNDQHHDLEIVYAQRYIAWRTCRVEELVKASEKLLLALGNLQYAGYTARQIVRIEHHAEELIRRLQRPVGVVDVSYEGDTEPMEVNDELS